MSAKTSLRVIVAGGGIGGLALAHGLRKAGIDVAVYERDRHRTDRLQGFRIHISPRGSRALHELLPDHLYRAFVAHSNAVESEIGFGFATERMSTLLDLDRETIEGNPTGDVDRNFGVSRITLRQILLSDLDDVVHYDKAITGYTRLPDGRVEARFADGTTACGDVLVGADGATSRVRAQLLPHAQRVDTGIVAIAGKYMLTEQSRRRLAPRLQVAPVSVIPPRSCGMFVAPHEFGAADGDSATIGGNDGAAQRYPGALFDNTRPYVLWSYAAKRADFAEDLESLGPKELQDLADRLTADWSPQLRELVTGCDTDTVTLLPIRTSVPVEPWETTNVTLLGDALHSMTPFRGIGANVALRDAHELTGALIAAARDERPLLEALHEYEAQMITYGFAAVRASLQAAEQSVSDSRVSRTMVRTVFRLAGALPPLKRKMFGGLGSEPEPAKA
ncbi:FAD-dependent oxidoreductase [Nocardia macrotermitis]|uniref:Kynurenine 3-monooxygenase n=1 Tax=Nocardia macrotermitis TaxID=2585198 RepID=A0A7K0D5U7_9NOCA|nr:NAD(P)/FAD-dependent oxidoreductase [Nocardia macrotermitis]MQY21123.1 Kynurenine 3-monooxygenase [Nocardia macrotermitis]